METKYNLKDNVYYIQEPENYDMKSLRGTKIFNGEIASIEIREQGILYRFQGNGRSEYQRNIDTNKSDLFRKFFKRIIELKEGEILEIKQGLLKEVVDLHEAI